MYKIYADDLEKLHSYLETRRTCIALETPIISEED